MGRIRSAVLVQANGWQRSFQPAMKVRMDDWQFDD